MDIIGTVRAVDIIAKKRAGQALSSDEIAFVVKGAVSGDVPDYQTAALLMAIFLRGMDRGEAAALTGAMVDSGVRLDLSGVAGPKVDKHSTGGVGDKTSLIIAPVVAACGGVVPMMSGRALGHTGGTLDKLESIPGFRTRLSLAEITAALHANGCALVGQTDEIAPADRTLYALRDATATIECVPLIAASILSKKIAEGVDALVVDVKTGAGAFMRTLTDARRLAETLVDIGRAFGLVTRAVLTRHDAPLGRAVGNALEVIECLEVMKGRGPGDVTELSLELSGRMLIAAGLAATHEEAVRRSRAALESGAALEKFRAIVARQGGDPAVIDDYGRLPAAPERAVVASPSSGWVTGIDAGRIGRASSLLGAGRERVEDAIDPGVGVLIRTAVGEPVKAGEAVLELCYRDAARLAAAEPVARRAIRVSDAEPPQRGIILDEVG